jgi:hypothetical protein
MFATLSRHASGGGGASVPGACRSGPDVSHTSFCLLVVLPDPSLVRFKTLIFFGKPGLELLYPLIYPPQGADVHGHDLIGDVLGLLSHSAEFRYGESYSS